jgi:hypothetical protein
VTDIPEILIGSKPSDSFNDYNKGQPKLKLKHNLKVRFHPEVDNQMRSAQRDAVTRATEYKQVSHHVFAAREALTRDTTSRT